MRDHLADATPLRLIAYLRNVASRARNRSFVVKITVGFSGREQALSGFYAATFTVSEGGEEGALIGGLVRDLLSSTSGEDIRVFCVEEDSQVIGAAIFTRLTYPEDPHIVFLLSPMAVASERQRKGIGQALLRHALAALRADGVQIAMTYGDPNFYGRVGFRSVTENRARAPLRLNHPHGWLGQSLTDETIPTLQGPSFCVPALNRSDVW
jgi:putative acetyltransferase